MSIDGQVIGGVVSETRRSQGSHRITRGRFDLDDVRPEVSGHHGAQGSSQDAREVHDTNSLERQPRADVGVMKRPQLLATGILVRRCFVLAHAEARLVRQRLHHGELLIGLLLSRQEREGHETRQGEKNRRHEATAMKAGHERLRHTRQHRWL